MPGKKRSRKKPEPAQPGLWDSKQDFRWKDFKVAREYIRSRKLKGYYDWKEFVNAGNIQDTDIPENPDTIYKNHGWNGWEDWLGIEIPKKIKTPSLNQLFDRSPEDNLWSGNERTKWLNFYEARNITREYGFEYEEEWRLFVDGKFPDREALPGNIPGNPDHVYRFVGWKDWKDWLIHPERQIDYTGFYRAREFVRSNRIPDKVSWRNFLQKESGLIDEYKMALPVRPHLEYRDSGWQSWEDWLGSGISFHDFKSTREFVRSLKLKNRQEWDEFCRGHLTHKPRKTENTYAYPEIAFRDEEWKGWEDWLGTGIAKETGSSPSKTSEISIECNCKGRIKDCPECDGKGYYYVRVR